MFCFTYLVSLSADCNELELEGFLETDFNIVGTNVDMVDVAETWLIPVEVVGAGRAGGSTWTLSSCDTLYTWPGEKGSILGVDDVPLQLSVRLIHMKLIVSIYFYSHGKWNERNYCRIYFI